MCSCSFFIFPKGWYGYVRYNYLTWVKTMEITIWCARKSFVDMSKKSRKPHLVCKKIVSKYLGDNCIQNFHLGRYIVVYTVGNLVLRRRVSGAVKRDFRTYIRRYTSPNVNFEYGYPHSNALLTFSHKKTVKMHFFAPIRPATLAA